MNVVIFGATGMVGSGVLIECLEDPAIESVVVIGRQSSGVSHPKLREIVAEDLFDLKGSAEELASCDACFYCLGVSAVGMSEAEYRRITLDLTKAVTEVLVALVSSPTFVARAQEEL